MMIKQILGAVVASTALMSGVAISQDTPPEQQVAPAQTTAAEATAEKVDDGMLAVNVKAALVESPDTQAYQINVESQEGIVRLLGAVDNAKAKEAATTVAKSVKGVKEIKNELTVTGT
ncbi:MAG: BON domain-containing protein [Steroidobacteraceae bacterium]